MSLLSHKTMPSIIDYDLCRKPRTPISAYSSMPNNDKQKTLSD
ncbi:hypothetical protein [Helicobacter enhydrae]|nr:hypothetical protein [Helicobacter enhydrae]